MRSIFVIAGGLAVVLGLGHIVERGSVPRSNNRRPLERPDAVPVDAAGREQALHLDTAADRDAFRLWFAYLAEEAFFRDTSALPRDVTDCSALVRYAYREALRKHDGEWASGLGLRWPPPLPSVSKYQYPHTPIGANLFRTGVDEFAQFADARTLREWNTHLVSRDLAEALPGDLLFYRQLAQDMPYHVMAVLGASRIEESADGPYVVYHTGPSADYPGEMRRPSVAELSAHPEPRWRPVDGNSNFLGVYRWNILRD
ncbi:MAG: DUF1175 family protein [Bryobacteraceae bacterium]